MITSDLACVVPSEEPRSPLLMTNDEGSPDLKSTRSKSVGKENVKDKSARRKAKMIKGKSTSHIELPQKIDKKRGFKLFSKKIITRTVSSTDVKSFLTSNHSDKESPRKEKKSRIPRPITVTSLDELPESHIGLIRSKSEGGIDPLKSEIIADKIMKHLEGEIEDNVSALPSQRSPRERPAPPLYTPPPPPPMYTPPPPQLPLPLDPQPQEANEGQYSDLANYFVKLKSKAKELGIWETPLNSSLPSFKDKTNIPLKLPPVANDSNQWIIVRRLLTQRGGVKLKIPANITQLLEQAGEALKIEPCKVRDIQTQTEITSLDLPYPSVVFITTEDEELSYFSLC